MRTHTSHGSRALLLVAALAGGLMTWLATPVLSQERPNRACQPRPTAAFHRCALEKMKTFKPRLTPDGKPDLSGYWERTGNAQDLEGYSDTLMPSGIENRESQIVDPPDGKVPYQPWARAQQQEDKKKYISPSSFCFMSGVRFNYFWGSEILQTPTHIVMFQERVHGARIIPIAGGLPLGKSIQLWNGDARGRWEGNTLVVQISNFNGLTTFDHAMNFASPDVKMTERFTLIDPDTLHWEATVEDPKVFIRPWKIAMAMVRVIDPSFEVMEEACHEGSQHLGDLGPFFGAGYKVYPGYRGPKMQ